MTTISSSSATLHSRAINSCAFIWRSRPTIVSSFAPISSSHALLMFGPRASLMFLASLSWSCRKHTVFCKTRVSSTNSISFNIHHLQIRQIDRAHVLADIVEPIGDALQVLILLCQLQRNLSKHDSLHVARCCLSTVGEIIALACLSP